MLEEFAYYFIRLAYQQAVAAAKDIYSNTRIGEKPVSVVS